jgi:signal transduction histidine kinase
MKIKLGFYSKSVIAFLFVLAIGAAITWMEVYYKGKLEDEVIETSKRHSQNAIARLYNSSQRIILELHETYQLQFILDKETKNLDSILKVISRKELSDFIGVEGGFYFYQQDKFLGFSFPTSEPPEPVYGPPPREYNIIRDQLKESIKNDLEKINKYQFKPTVFVLATKPLLIDDTHSIGIYTLMRVEKLLPVSFWGSYFRIEVILSLIGILIAIIVSWVLRKRVENIKIGLEQIKDNPSLRLKQEKGILGAISTSINDLLDSREQEQKERERLEIELRTKDRMASLGNLIAGVTHQVKTPLAIIKTKIQMWQRKLANKENNVDISETISDASMKDVVEEIDKLTGLVNRLLLFLKNPVTELKLNDLNEVIQKAVHTLQYEFEAKNIKVDFIQNDIPKLKIDFASVEQVILNLLVNSIQAMPNGGNIKIQSQKTDDGKVVLEIADTGKGIDKTVIEKVFDPFFTTKPDGSGLGLSVAYEIVKAHNGTISFVSGSTNGAVCKIVFPIN